MTTDTQLAPTDDEIDALIDQHRWDTTEGRRGLVREVLARWGQTAIATRITVPTNTMEQEFQNYYRRGFEAGKKANQPAHSGEPVATVQTIHGVTVGYLETAVPAGAKLYTAQPVERELLCSTELESYSDAYADTPDEAVAFRDGWRLAEQHYGIKGGQHD